MLYQVVLNLQYLEQAFVNRWNYVMSGTPVGVTGSFALVQALGLYATGTPANFPVGTLGAAIQGILNEQSIFVQTIVQNVYDPLDFYDSPFVNDVVGGVSGTGMSPVNAIGITSTRVRTDIRRGQKRFGGVPVGYVENGGQITTIALGFAQIVADRMGESPEYTAGGNALTFSPAIVSKLRTVDGEGKVSYVYYPTLSEQLAHTALGIQWSPKTTIRTQGSRQYGRGQ